MLAIPRSLRGHVVALGEKKKKLPEILEQSCTLKRKTCQEDRQVCILEAAQCHSFVTF